MPILRGQSAAVSAPRELSHRTIPLDAIAEIRCAVGDRMAGSLQRRKDNRSETRMFPGVLVARAGAEYSGRLRLEMVERVNGTGEMSKDFPLGQHLDNLRQGEEIDRLRARIAALESALLESAAREKKMREALETIIDNRVGDVGTCPVRHGCNCSQCVARAALAPLSPDDVSAMQRVIEDAKAERTRECEDFVLNFGRGPDANPTGASVMIVAALRAKYPEVM